MKSESSAFKVKQCDFQLKQLIRDDWWLAYIFKKDYPFFLLVTKLI